MSAMNVGEYDIRNTAEEWIDILNVLDDPEMIFLIAEALSNKDLVRKENAEDAEEKIILNMNRDEIIQYALEKYLQFSGGIDKLFARIRQSKDIDSLLLKLNAIDLVLKRMKMDEVQYVHIFLNSYRDFIPWDLLKIKIGDVFKTMAALEKTQEIKALSGKIIES